MKAAVARSSLVRPTAHTEIDSAPCTSPYGPSWCQGNLWSLFSWLMVVVSPPVLNIV